ncbi:MAG: GNAT family N-acetyltransferase [Proteiniphilum sp.]|nr:GNAT family N-acetyltransferase [Proteiniphilum sp.]
MESNMGSIRIYTLDEYIYPKFRAKIVSLYLHAFTTGEYAQYIAPESAESTLDALVRRGFGKMAFIDERLVGLLLCHPLSYDKDFPAADHPRIPVANSIYISEVMVHTHERGKGIALKMISDLLMSLPDTFTDIVIRVWEKNEPALSLYRKLGFEPFYSIIQTKHRSPEETFEMKKIYLHKALIPGER